VIHKYLDIKAGNIPARPITIFFGGKAAPAYTIAQDIIHLILCLSEVIANDPAVAPHLQVVFNHNYLQVFTRIMEKSKARADKAFSPPLMRLRDWIFLPG
ncbi:glycogen/starch/alpha-glucan phosphorylase, partial [Streptococcus gordonii]